MKPAAPRVQIGSYPKLKSKKYKERVGKNVSKQKKYLEREKKRDSSYFVLANLILL